MPFLGRGAGVLKGAYAQLPRYFKDAGYVTAAIGKWHVGGTGFGPLEHGFEIYHPGQAMQITGMVTALSGEPVSGAEIKADVYLQPVYGPRRWSPFAGQKIRITTVRAATDPEGRFTCKWVSIAEGSSPFGDGSIDRIDIRFGVPRRALIERPIREVRR